MRTREKSPGRSRAIEGRLPKRNRASMKAKRKKAGTRPPVIKVLCHFPTPSSANHVTIKPKHPKAYLRSSVMRQKKRI
jgi:hypothetical protein